MLEFAIRHHVVIDAMTAVRKYNLRKYELGSMEWKIAMELRDVLEVFTPFLSFFFFAYSHYFVQIFKEATLFFSCDTPNLATVIPAMDHINNVLTASSNSNKYSLPIRAALTISKRTLSKYYNKATGESEVYRIAMGTLVLQSNLYISDCNASSPSPSTQA